MRDAFFYLGLGLLCTHEMDAMPNHEWRVLPVVRAVEDTLGAQVFLAAHIPLFAVVIGLIASLQPRRRRVSRMVLSGFLVVHSALHAAFSGHVHYEFHSILSSLLIYGAGCCGVVYLLAQRNRPIASQA